MRRGGRRTGSEESRFAADIISLRASTLNLGGRRDTFGKTGSARRNIPPHPVNDVVRTLAHRYIGIVQDHRKGNGAVGHHTPLHRGRNRTGLSRTGKLPRNVASITESGNRQLERGWRGHF